jgi:hypothetical protein
LKNKPCFFKEKLTWFEAQRCCASRFGQLATIDDTIVNCNNIPSGAETLWTGSVTMTDIFEIHICVSFDFTELTLKFNPF